MANLLGALLAILLSLGLFSLLFGDNPFYRVAEGVLIGVALGYALLAFLFQGGFGVFFAGGPHWFALGLLLLGLLLPLRLVPTLRRGSRIPLALVVGVLTAVALVGALQGTLLPLLSAAVAPFRDGPRAVLSGAVALLVFLLVLLSFQYTGPRGRVHRWGEGLLFLVLGFALGEVAASGFALAAERLQWIWTQLPTVLSFLRR